VHRHLQQVGIEVTAVDLLAPADATIDHVTGSAIDAATLHRARIEHADAIVVATPNDTTNLAIAMLARELNPRLFMVLRQSERRNTPLFRAVDADITTLSGYIVAAEVLRIIQRPAAVVLPAPRAPAGRGLGARTAGTHARAHR
jgi:voltage-gated potassium channel